MSAIMLIPWLMKRPVQQDWLSSMPLLCNAWYTTANKLLQRAAMDCTSGRFLETVTVLYDAHGS